jgi:hypothetical protein
MLERICTLVCPYSILKQMFFPNTTGWIIIALFNITTFEVSTWIKPPDKNSTFEISDSSKILVKHNYISIAKFVILEFLYINFNG